jgi:hypothetical protein
VQKSNSTADTAVANAGHAVGKMKGLENAVAKINDVINPASTGEVDQRISTAFVFHREWPFSTEPLFAVEGGGGARCAIKRAEIRFFWPEASRRYSRSWISMKQVQDCLGKRSIFF